MLEESFPAIIAVAFTLICMVCAIAVTGAR
jgi:hypothetical protein